MGRQLRIPAIEVQQSPGRVLYTFAVDGKLVPTFATVSRIKRDEGASLSGYQRPEVLSHIGEIRTYLESESPLVPNAVVIAFDSRATFVPLGAVGEFSRAGEFIIPLEENEDDAHLPGFIVDGQQRLAAIRDAALERFPICVTAFITDDVREQTEQFILVNSTKPLPKGLIYELLPSTEAQLPSLLVRRRLPAYLAARLNFDDSSPLRGLIQTPTNPNGIMKDNSILRAIENSLSDGILYRLRNSSGDEPDPEPLLGALNNFWTAVREVFRDAWGLPAKRSRLMHGAGVASLGFLMDAISEHYRSTAIPTESQFRKDLKPLKEVCRWTDGYWNFGPGLERKWCDVQNTTKDIKLLSNYLFVQYKARVWTKARSRGGQLELSGR